MQLDVLKTGKKKVAIEVEDNVFAAEFNEPLVHQVVTAYMAGARKGTKAQKTRSEARGGGRKPWRQKGLGRARAGTIRSPIWRGGGVTFAAKPRKHAQKVNRKMYRSALCSILSELVRQERLVLVEEFSIEQPKTKLLKEKLEKMEFNEVLIVVSAMSENLYLASRNLPQVEVISVDEINPFALIAYDKVLMSKDVIENLQGRLI